MKGQLCLARSSVFLYSQFIIIPSSGIPCAIQKYIIAFLCNNSQSPRCFTNAGTGCSGICKYVTVHPKFHSASGLSVPLGSLTYWFFFNPTSAILFMVTPCISKISLKHHSLSWLPVFVYPPTQIFLCFSPLIGVLGSSQFNDYILSMYIDSLLCLQLFSPFLSLSCCHIITSPI